jgi:hypothetical protein
MAGVGKKVEGAAKRAVKGKATGGKASGGKGGAKKGKGGGKVEKVAKEILR